jgi:hypothetical protein
MNRTSATPSVATTVPSTTPSKGLFGHLSRTDKIRFSAMAVLAIGVTVVAMTRPGPTDLSKGDCIDLKDNRAQKVDCSSDDADFRVGVDASGDCDLWIDLSYGSTTETYCVTKV